MFSSEPRQLLRCTVCRHRANFTESATFELPSPVFTYQLVVIIHDGGCFQFVAFTPNVKGSLAQRRCVIPVDIDRFVVKEMEVATRFGSRVLLELPLEIDSTRIVRGALAT